MKTIKDLIADHPFLDGLDKTDFETIAGCGSNVVFKAGTFIFKAGGDADHFYLLRDGDVALESFVPGKGPTIFQTLDGTDILGASWMVAPYRWGYDAHATSDVRAVAFDAKCLRGKCDDDHDLGYKLMTRFVPVLVARLNAARLQVADVYADTLGTA